MVANNSYNAKIDQVAEMFALAHQSKRIWRQEELNVLLRHQLDAPLALDLSGGNRLEALRIHTLLHGENPPINTLRDLLHHPHPPKDILSLTKVFFKTLRTEMDGFFATEVATVLYYAVILVAQHRLNMRMSTQPDAVLTEGYRWAAAQSWMDDNLRQLFTQVLHPASVVLKSESSRE